jgi:hypothetical protein
MCRNLKGTHHLEPCDVKESVSGLWCGVVGWSHVARDSGQSQTLQVIVRSVKLRGYVWIPQFLYSYLDMLMTDESVALN